jgi:ankyrin repeat protein
MMVSVPGKVHLETIQAAIKPAGAKLPLSSRQAALRRAALIGHLSAVVALLAEGTEVNASDEHGRTALMEAAFAGHVDIVKTLTERGADVNATDKTGWTALMEAASKGHGEIVRILLAGGADVNKSGANGWTALRAAARGHTDIRQSLRAAGRCLKKSPKAVF